MAAAADPGSADQFVPIPVNESVIQALSTKNLDIKSLIGRGSFSEVFRAIHTETEEVLAIKCFRQELTTKSLYESAAKEIAIMRVMYHPNITAVEMYEISQTYVYIGTEYGCFASLHTYSRRRNLHEPEVKKLMVQVISAVDYMHGIGICHGDLKLQNIICYKIENGVPHIKVADFGLSEIKINGTPFTYSNGSILFMAPELVLSKPVDLTCDVWSAGVIMYALMFKRHPFNLKPHPHPTLKDLADIMRVQTAPELKGISKFSPTCAQFLNGLLQYDPKKRLHGSLLRDHPFINIQKQEYNHKDLYLRAKNNISSAIKRFENKDYGHALLDAKKSVLELQIMHNLSSNAAQREKLKLKWKSYEKFIDKIITALLSKPDLDSKDGPISNKEMREQLASTPRLLTGFDIGIHGEMYLQEGNRNKARELFHQALQIILPLMKSEPSSTRKKALAIKLKKWIDCLQKLEHPSVESDASTVPFSSISMAASGPSHFSNF